MRTLLAIAAMTACGYQEPTGTPQTWPPPLGVSIESVVAGDLDGDGISEIVACSSGGNAGAYLIEGSQSLAAGTTPSAFTAFTSESFGAQIAGTLYVESNAGQVAAAYGGSDHVELARFDAHLAEARPPERTELPAAGTVLWLAPARRTNGTVDLLVGNGTEVHYVPGDGGVDVAIQTQLPAPVVIATTFYTLGVRKIMVANVTDAETATLNVDGSIGAWTPIRTGGPMWLGQTPFDLDGDGQPEILAYDPAASQLCMLYLSDGTTSCVATGETTTGGAVTIVPGAFEGGTAPDVAIVHATEAAAQIGLVQDVTFDGFNLMGAGQGTVGAPMSLTAAHAVAIQRGPGHHDALLLVGRAGLLQCSFCD